MLVVGLISGTSMDAIDAALVELRHEQATLHMRLVAYVEHPYAPALHERLRALLPPAPGSVAEVCELNVLLGEAFAEAAQAVAQTVGMPMVAIDLVASHGQTVYHQVAPGRARSSLQLAAPAVIAARTGCSVVADFRLRDMAEGGQGAPLAPSLDALLWTHPARARAIQNIGGIANVTYLPPGGDALAFDTGPGNALLDEAVRLLSNGRQAYDHDGAWAAQGRIDEELLKVWLGDPYFALPLPKSTGREYFDRAYALRCVAEAQARGLNDTGVLASLTALTARSIAIAYQRLLPAPAHDVILSGGGARNPTLVRMLAQALPDAAIYRSDDLGLPGDAKEAVLFAVLGYATLHCWPGNLPTCTGARRAAPLGSITPGDNYRALLARVAADFEPPPRRAVLSLRLRSGHGFEF